MHLGGYFHTPMAPRDSQCLLSMVHHTPSGEFLSALECSLELEESLEISQLQASQAGHIHALPSTAVRKHQSRQLKEQRVYLGLRTHHGREACWQAAGTVGDGGIQLRLHIFSHKHPTERSGSRTQSQPLPAVTHFLQCTFPTSPNSPTSWELSVQTLSL